LAQEGEAGSNAVSIRKYASRDLAVLLSVCRRAPEAAQWTEDGFQQAVSSGQVMLVAEVGTGEAARFCGFLVARAVAGEVELLNMAVDAVDRRKGLGSKLLAAAAKEVAWRQAKRIHLEVRESNQVAISFYGRHGFRKSGERRSYYQNPTENAVLMEKKLTD
jgi:ribosomal-protein-alanine acetyltransferase